MGKRRSGRTCVAGGAGLGGPCYSVDCCHRNEKPESPRPPRRWHHHVVNQLFHTVVLPPGENKVRKGCLQGEKERFRVQAEWLMRLRSGCLGAEPVAIGTAAGLRLDPGLFSGLRLASEARLGEIGRHRGIISLD